MSRKVEYVNYINNGGDLANLPKPVSPIEIALYALCQKHGGSEESATIQIRKGTTNIEYSTDGTTWNAICPVSDLKGAKGDTGATGSPGAAGKNGADGAKGDPGATGVGVKSITLTKDANGAITSGTWNDTANTSHTITISTTTA